MVLVKPVWATHKAKCEGKRRPKSRPVVMSGVSESLEIKPDCCEAKGLAAAIKPPEHGCGRKKAPARCPVQRRTFTYVRTSPLFLLPVDLDARRPPTGFLKSVFRKPVRKCLPVVEKLDKVALSSWCSYWSAEAPARDQDESRGTRTRSR